jgi:hypothetical protein
VAPVVRVKCGHRRARLANEWEALLAEPERWGNDPGQIGRGLSDRHAVKRFSSIQITLLLTEKRHGLKERNVK